MSKKDLNKSRTSSVAGFDVDVQFEPVDPKKWFIYKVKILGRGYSDMGSGMYWKGLKTLYLQFDDEGEAKRALQDIETTFLRAGLGPFPRGDQERSPILKIDKVIKFDKNQLEERPAGVNSNVPGVWFQYKWHPFLTPAIDLPTMDINKTMDGKAKKDHGDHEEEKIYGYPREMGPYLHDHVDSNRSFLDAIFADSECSALIENDCATIRPMGDLLPQVSINEGNVIISLNVPHQGVVAIERIDEHDGHVENTVKKAIDDAIEFLSEQVEAMKSMRP